MAMSKLLSTLQLILIPLLILIGIWIWSSKPKELGTVDVVAITSDFVRSEAQRHHSKQEKEAAIKSFSHRLENALSDLSHTKSLILVPKEAVLIGGKDYTQAVLVLMQKESPA